MILYYMSCMLHLSIQGHMLDHHEMIKVGMGYMMVVLIKLHLEYIDQNFEKVKESCTIQFLER